MLLFGVYSVSLWTIRVLFFLLFHTALQKTVMEDGIIKWWAFLSSHLNHICSQTWNKNGRNRLDKRNIYPNIDGAHLIHKAILRWKQRNWQMAKLSVAVQCCRSQDSAHLQDSTYIFIHLCSAAVLPSLIQIIIKDFITLAELNSTLNTHWLAVRRSINRYKISMHKYNNWNKKNTIS